MPSPTPEIAPRWSLTGRATSIRPTADIRLHAGQLEEYLRATGAPLTRASLHDAGARALGRRVPQAPLRIRPFPYEAKSDFTRLRREYLGGLPRDHAIGFGGGTHLLNFGIGRMKSSWYRVMKPLHLLGEVERL